MQLVFAHGAYTICGKLRCPHGTQACAACFVQMDKDERSSIHGQAWMITDFGMHDLVFTLELIRAQQYPSKLGHRRDEHVGFNCVLIFWFSTEDQPKSV